jgi:hypothetical protein
MARPGGSARPSLAFPLPAPPLPTDMRTVLHALSSLAFLAVLPAQTEWVTNGSFTGALAPWTLGGGYSVNPSLDTTWDTTGLGVSDSFGVNAGGQVTPPPYAPNTIEQQILIVQGLTYEFRADVSAARPASPTSSNAHAGRVWVEIDNIEIGRVDFGSYVSNQVERAQLVGRHVGHTSAMVTLRLSFQRDYLCNATTPRLNVDNVSLRDTQGPTYWLEGNRKIGTTVPQRLAGDPNTLFATFVALGENPVGLPIPGVTGLLMIDPLSAVSLGAGLLDAMGSGTVPFAVPNDPAFVTTPLYYQAVGVGTALVLSLHFGCVCTQ